MFRVTLPVAVHEGGIRHDQAPYSPIILIADDEAAIRTNLKLLLESEGYQVREAADGGEAARQLQDPDVALCLLDLKMPVLRWHGSAARPRGSAWRRRPSSS